MGVVTDAALGDSRFGPRPGPSERCRQVSFPVADRPAISTKIGTEIANSLAQYWNAWTKVIPFIPPKATLKVMTTPTMTIPAQYGQLRIVAHRHAGSLHLGHRVEEADEQDEGHGDLAEAGESNRPSAKSGIV